VVWGVSRISGPVRGKKGVLMSMRVTPGHVTEGRRLETLILEESFAGGGLPAGWYTDTAYPKYAVGAWDCRSWDGVVVPLPRDGWEWVSVVVEVEEVAPGTTVHCGADGRTGMNLVLGGGPSARHSIGDGGNTLLESKVPVAITGTRMVLGFEWTPAAMAMGVDGKEIGASRNLRKDARVGQLHLGIRGCVVKRVAVYGKALEEKVREIKSIRTGFPLEVTVDFNDDLIPTPWTQKTFDALFTELKSWGTSKVSWIDLGREVDHYFDHGPYKIGEHGRQTFKNVGDIFTCAVKTAHAHGMELYGLFKPYDMAIAGITVPPNHPDAGAKNRIRQIGGSLGWATKMACENRGLMMSRKPGAYGAAVNEVWTRIDLVKDDDAADGIGLADVSFIVSGDNDRYYAYEGPVKASEAVEEYPVYKSTPSGPVATGVKRRVRVLRFEGLKISEPFMAIQVKGIAGSSRTFANRLCDLIHVFGEKGEETRMTYGFTARKAGHVAMFDAPAGSVQKAVVGPEGGFEFNRYPGAPSEAATSGADPIIAPIALDRGAVSYIALAKGKDRSPVAAMSPCFKETRELWMGWIKAMLDSGADGIDIRPGGHHSDMAWIEYGFEAPVREEMLKRTGVDIWATDDFDYDVWRRVRGGGYSQFIREASAVVRARGKKLTVHIDGHFDGPPGLGGAMNLVCDWRSWIEEGLIDSITGKSLWPGNVLSRQVLEAAHAKGIAVSYCPYLNNFFEDRSTMNHIGDSPKGCHVPVGRHIAWGKAFGYDGFVFYEEASALWAGADGTVFFRPNAGPVKDVLREEFVF
jgi:hypothetical protein